MSKRGKSVIKQKTLVPPSLEKDYYGCEIFDVDYIWLSGAWMNLYGTCNSLCRRSGVICQLFSRLKSGKSGQKNKATHKIMSFCC